MKMLRWIASFPAAMSASFLAWVGAMKMFSGIASHYGGGFFHSVLGLLPLITSAAIPTTIFVLAGVLVAPSKERRVCFVFFALSLLFSAGGLHMLQYQDGYLGFWLASAGGVVAGAVVGLAAALRIQRMRRPIQSPQERQKGSGCERQKGSGCGC